MMNDTEYAAQRAVDRIDESIPAPVVAEPVVHRTLYAPKCGLPVDANYVRAYGIGYFYGRQHGDRDPGREEMEMVYGRSDRTNLLAYEGFDVGYHDGVNDYAEIHDDVSGYGGRDTPSPANAWGG